MSDCRRNRIHLKVLRERSPVAAAGLTTQKRRHSDEKDAPFDEQ
jgi:hypothetical protein